MERLRDFMPLIWGAVVMGFFLTIGIISVLEG